MNDTFKMRKIILIKFLFLISSLRSSRKLDKSTVLIDLYETIDFKHQTNKIRVINNCLLVYSDMFAKDCKAVPERKVISIGTKKNLIRALGLFLVTLLNTRAISMMELVTNKIKKNSRFDILLNLRRVAFI